MDNVIVTGGSGLLGAEIVHRLIKKENVKPIVMDVNPDPKRLDDVKDQIEYIKGDVSDPKLLNDTFAKYKPTKIFHLVTIPGNVCENDPVLATKVNAMGFINLMEAALKNGMPQVLYSSSGTTFGEDIEPSIMLTDKTLQRPASFYGITKVFNETAGRWYRKKHNLDYRGIRYPAICGPGLRAEGVVTYVSAMIELPAKGKPYAIPVGKDVSLSLVYVEDAARALIRLSKAPKEDIKTINYFINGVQNPLPNTGEMAETVRKLIPGADITFDVNPDWNKLLKSASHPVVDTSSVKEWHWRPKYNTWEKVVRKYLEDLNK